MADDLVKIFEAPRGVNTVDDPKSGLFQPPTRERPEPPFLTHAENVDVTRTGGYQRRRGRTRLRALTSGHSLWSYPLALFYADEGTLYRFLPESDTDEVIATGLNPLADIHYTELAGQVLWANGHQVGRAVNGQGSFWGVQSADAPGLSDTSGSLAPGRYLVAVTAVREGIEGGIRAWGAIDVVSGGIEITPNGIDPDADELAVYVSLANGEVPYFHRLVPVGESLIVTSPVETDLECDGMGVYPPPTGHLVAVWGGFALVAHSDPDGTHALYASEPGSPHRFRLARDVQVFPSRIVLLEPMVDGVYVALESGGTFWISGNDPHEWSIRQVDDRRVAEGTALRVPASKLPWLKADLESPVAVWSTSDGLAVGLPSGMVRYPHDGTLALPTSAKASLSYVERPGLRQLLMSARDPQMGSRLGAGDQLTITVTRGGVPL